MLYVLANSIGACIDETCQDFYTVNAKPFKAESAVITSKSPAQFYAVLLHLKVLPYHIAAAETKNTIFL